MEEAKQHLRSLTHAPNHANLNRILPHNAQSQPEFNQDILEAINQTPGQGSSLNLNRPWQFYGEPLSNAVTSRQIRILALTYNMFGQKPTADIRKLLKPEIQHHIYLIASQECLRSIGKSLLNEDKQEWEVLIKRCLGPRYIQVQSATLGAIHLIMFAHIRIYEYITNIQVDSVKTGIGNLISNKGAVAISFYLGNESFLVVSCHLASGQHHVMKRNQDFMRINRQLSLLRDASDEDLASDRADVVIWMGDLNYRINGPRTDVIFLIQEGVIEPLRRSDQFQQQRTEGNVAVGFHEGDIAFLPTYRFDPNTSTYDTSKKKRVPAWTDRVLYKSKKNDLQQVNYDANMDYNISDHKAVISQFILNWEPVIREVQNTSTVKSSTCSIF